MTEPQQRQQAIAAAQQVAASVDALGKDVKALSKRMGLSEADRARLHRMTWLVLGLAAVALALAGWLTFQQVNVNDNAASLNALHSAQVDVCSASNSRLASQKALWAYLLAKSTPPKDATAAEKARMERELAHIRALVNSAFAPRQCGQLYRIP